MRLCRRVLFAGLAALLLASPLHAQRQPRVRVAVLTFRAIGVPAEIGEAVTEIIRTELVDVGGFELVERGQIEAIIREQKLQMKDLFEEKKAVEIGRLSGASLVVIGSIVKLGRTFTLNSRFIEVETGITRKGKNIRGNSEDELSNMSRQLAFIIAGKTYEEKRPAGPPSSGETPAPRCSRFASRCWAGEWTSTFGPIDIQQKGKRIYGKYAYRNGRFEGTLVTPTRAKGRWHEGNANTDEFRGDFLWDLTPDGTKFNGIWGKGFGRPMNQLWTGTKR